MNVRGLRTLPALLAVVAVGCTEGTTTGPTANPTPPVVSLTAPSAIETGSGPFFGWPTLAVANATKTNTTNTLEYQFEISARSDFASIAHTAGVPETPGQTSYTPPATLATPAEGTLYWRATAIDRANAVQSVSGVQSFTHYENTEQSRLAVQAHGGLWSGVRPTGAAGRARLGPGWGVAVKASFDGVVFQSPPLEVLRIYDLLDHGYNPDSAIAFMHANGYPTVAVWYPSVACIGFPFQYMAYIAGSWELVHRIGA